MKIQNINPYSQHYRCMAQLIKNATLSNIFTYLLDEHLVCIRKGKASGIPVSFKKIGECAGIARQTVGANLEKLGELRLITVSNDVCYINENYLIAVVTLFNQQTSEKDKEKVSTLFRKTDIEGLKRIGLLDVRDGQEELLCLEGNLVLSEDEEGVKDLTQPCYNSNMCVKDLTPHVKDLTQPCYNSNTHVKILTRFADNMIEKLSQNTECVKDLTCYNSNTGVKDLTYPHVKDLTPHVKDLTRNLLNLLVEAQKLGYDVNLDELLEKSLDFLSEIAVSTCYIFNTGGVKDLTYPPVKDLTRGCYDFNTINNIVIKEENKKNKSPLQEIEEKNNEIKAIKEELEALKEQVKEKTTSFQSKNKNYDEEPEDDEEDEEDIKARRRQSFQLDIIELKGPGADESEKEAEERAMARTARYKESVQNGTYRMPYHFQLYSRQEAEELISDIHKCVKRPDQIFINQLWEVLTEFIDYKFGEEPEEEDLMEGKHPQSLDPEKYFITPKELESVLKTATESTIQIIETGTTEDGDELEGLTGEEFNVDDVRLLMTWPQKTMADIGEVYIPSKEGFRDIKKLKEGVQSTKSPKRDPERAERDYTYMQAIMVMADRHDGLEDLTLAEYIAYHFIWDHLQLDKNLRVVDYQLDEFTGNRIKELSRDGVTRLKMELKEEGMDFQDFLGTLNNGRVDAHGWLLFGKRAFSADAIMSWNEKNGCESKIPQFIKDHTDILVEAPYDGPEIELIDENWEEEGGGY